MVARSVIQPESPPVRGYAEFPYISRPGVVLQFFQGRGTEPVMVFLYSLKNRQKVIHHRGISSWRQQQRQHNFNRIDTIKKILAEFILRDHIVDLHVGRTYQADIDIAGRLDPRRVTWRVSRTRRILPASPKTGCRFHLKTACPEAISNRPGRFSLASVKAPFI